MATYLNECQLEVYKEVSGASELEFEGIVKDYESFTFTLNYLDIGQFQFYCSLDYGDLLKVGKLIMLRWYEDLSATASAPALNKNPMGVVRSIEYDTLHGKLLVSGESLESVAENRPSGTLIELAQNVEIGSTGEDLVSRLFYKSIMGMLASVSEISTEDTGTKYPLAGKTKEAFTIYPYDSLLSSMRLLTKNVNLQYHMGIQARLVNSNIIDLGLTYPKHEGNIMVGVTGRGSNAVYTQSIKNTTPVKYMTILYRDASDNLQFYAYQKKGPGFIPNIATKFYVDNDDTMKDDQYDAEKLEERKQDLVKDATEVITDLEEDYSYVMKSTDFDFWLGDIVHVTDPEIARFRDSATIDLYLTSIQFVVSAGRVVLLGTLSQSLEKGV